MGECSFPLSDSHSEEKCLKIICNLVICQHILVDYRYGRVLLIVHILLVHAASSYLNTCGYTWLSGRVATQMCIVEQSCCIPTACTFPL